MTMIYAIHAPSADRLAAVKAEMLVLGVPTIQVVDCGDHYMALEGSHRLAAAHELGFIPELIVYSQEDVLDVTQYDWYEAANWSGTKYTADEVAGELFSPSQARDYAF